jgi:hypothetical protein
VISGETVLSKKATGQEVDVHTSEFKVLSSNAGYYVGTSHVSCGKCDECLKTGLPEGFEQPGSRETGYFATRKLASQALETYKSTGVLPGQR